MIYQLCYIVPLMVYVFLSILNDQVEKKKKSIITRRLEKCCWTVHLTWSILFVPLGGFISVVSAYHYFPL